jgi:putative salt-induced outer membrane protein YdiY
MLATTCRARSVQRGLLLACLAVAGVHAQADQVMLKNGDRITGRVLRKADGILTVDTGYAGKLEIKWDQVSGLTTDGPVKVVLPDDSEVDAKLGESVEGHARLQTGLTPASIDLPLDRIVYINPTPVHSGKGVSFGGRVNLGASTTSGNTDSEHLHADAELRWRSRVNRYILDGEINEGEDGGERTVSNWRAGADYDHFFRPKNFFYARATLEHDEFKDIDLRSTLGAGLGYQIFDTDRTQLSVQGGLDYVNVERAVADDESYPAAGWGVRYDQQLFGGKVELFHTQDGYWSLEEVEDVILRTRSGLRFPLADGLDASAQVKIDWDNDPPPGRESTDVATILGLGYGW